MAGSVSSSGVGAASALGRLGGLLPVDQLRAEQAEGQAALDVGRRPGRKFPTNRPQRSQKGMIRRELPGWILSSFAFD